MRICRKKVLVVVSAGYVDRKSFSSAVPLVQEKVWLADGAQKKTVLQGGVAPVKVRARRCIKIGFGSLSKMAMPRFGWCK